MDGAVAVTNKWSRFYFISFYIIGVVMVLSLVVAFVVEAYFEEVEAMAASKHRASGHDSSTTSSSSSLPSYQHHPLGPGPHPSAMGLARHHLRRQSSLESLESLSMTPSESSSTRKLLRKRSASSKPRTDSISVEDFL